MRTTGIWHWMRLHEAAQRRVELAVRERMVRFASPTVRNRATAELFAERRHLEQEFFSRQWSPAIDSIAFLRATPRLSTEGIALVFNTSPRRILAWEHRATVPRGHHKHICASLDQLRHWSLELGKYLGRANRCEGAPCLYEWYRIDTPLLDNRSPSAALMAGDVTAVVWATRVMIDAMSVGVRRPIGYMGRSYWSDHPRDGSPDASATAEASE